MLVLTRRPQEAITIGDPDEGDVAVEIIVMEVQGDGVRLRIKPLRGVSMQTGNTQAGDTQAGDTQAGNTQAGGEAATAPGGPPARRR